MKTLLTLALTIVGCMSVAFGERIEISGPTMGTYFKVVVDGFPDDLDSKKLQNRIEASLSEFNAQMSTWLPDSEISKFNTSSSTEWFAVSEQFARVVQDAKVVHELSDGAFDPTVEPLIRLWGFGDDRERKLPSPAKIDEAKALVGMDHVFVRIEPPALRKDNPGLQLNLSAIAKGTAVDVLAELLAAEGLSAFVVDIGGETRAGVAKVNGDPWKLAIESPLGGFQRIVPVTEMAIATSGDYRNFFRVDGETYSHAIDATTGWPVKNPPAAVSVIAESCGLADAWATAMLVLGPQRGVEIAETHGLSVMFQQIADDETIRESAVGLFESDGATIANSETTPSEELDSAAVGEGKKDASAPWFPFVAAAVIFLIAITGMAVGTLLQNKSLKGSCGGLASMPGSEGKSICELCTIPKDECTNAELREQMQAAAAARECEESGC